jgi:hypothetical protein
MMLILLEGICWKYWDFVGNFVDLRRHSRRVGELFKGDGIENGEFRKERVKVAAFENSF